MELEQLLRIKEILKIPIDRVLKDDENFDVYSKEELVGTINYSIDSQGQIIYGDHKINWEHVFGLNEEHLRMMLLSYFIEPPYEIVVSNDFRHVWVTLEKGSKPIHIRFDYDTNWKLFVVEG